MPGDRPINLEIQPRHFYAGSAAAKKTAKAERARLEALGLKKPAQPSQQRERTIRSPAPRKRDSASLEPPSEAMADLLSAFGYPTAALAPKADRVYRDGEMDEPPPPKVRGPRPKRRPEDVRRMVAGGHWERACNACGLWQPETPNYYRWRQERKRWECECNACHNARRKAYYERNGA